MGEDPSLLSVLCNWWGCGVLDARLTGDPSSERGLETKRSEGLCYCLIMRIV